MQWAMTTILVLLLLTFLAVTKPSEADFQSWARTNIRADDNADLLERGMMFALRTQMNLETVYRDYTILAIIDTRVLDIRLRYLGIAGQWILLNREDPSEQRSRAIFED